MHAIAPEDSVEECKQWLAYWIVYGVFVIVGDFTWLEQLSLYQVVKVASLAFAAHNHGALNIFRSFVLPSLKRWEYVPNQPSVVASPAASRMPGVIGQAGQPKSE